MPKLTLTRLLVLITVPAAVIGLALDGVAGLKLVAAVAMIFAVIGASQAPPDSVGSGAATLAFFLIAFISAGSVRWRMLCACLALASVSVLHHWSSNHWR